MQTVTILGLVPSTSGPVNLCIIDALGRVVVDLTSAVELNGTQATATVQYSVNGIPAGMYYLCVQTRDGSALRLIHVAADGR